MGDRARAVPLAIRLAGVLQRIYPKHLLSWMMLRLTHIRFRPWKNRQIRWFIRKYGVDLGSAANPDPTSYPDFNTFFTRPLHAAARPLERSPRNILSPVDGITSEVGVIHDRRLIQAKGRSYTLTALFGDELRAATFAGGRFATIYLSPRDYHRVHIPLTATLRSMVYIPGELFSVNPTVVAAIDGLFTRNERVVSFFDTDLGPLAIALVGAVFVGGIEQEWCGAVTPPRGRRIRVERYDDAGIELEQGCEMGRFNMGSTVILTFANDTVEWASWLRPGVPVQMGQRIGGIPSEQ